MFTTVLAIAAFVGIPLIYGKAKEAIGITKFQPEFEKVENIKFSVSSITGIAVIRIRNISTTALEVTQIYLDIMAGGKKLADITANKSIFGTINIAPEGVSSVKIPFTALNKELVTLLKNSFGSNYPKSIEFTGYVEANGLKVPVNYSYPFDFSVVKESVTKVLNVVTNYIDNGINQVITDLKQLGYKAPFSILYKKQFLGTKDYFISAMKEQTVGTTKRLVEFGWDYNAVFKKVTPVANWANVKSTLTLEKQVV